MEIIHSGKKGQMANLNVADKENAFNATALAPFGFGMSFSLPQGARMVDIDSKYSELVGRMPHVNLGDDPDRNPFVEVKQEGETIENYGIDIEKLLALDPKDLDA